MRHRICVDLKGLCRVPNSAGFRGPADRGDQEELSQTLAMTRLCLSPGRPGRPNLYLEGLTSTSGQGQTGKTQKKQMFSGLAPSTTWTETP